MKDVIANLDNDWTLTGEDIDAYLRTHGVGALGDKEADNDRPTAGRIPAGIPLTD